MMLSIMKNLQKEIIILLICISISSLFLISAFSLKKIAYKNKNMSSSQLKQSRDKYYNALNKKLLLDKYEKQYEILMSAGIVGDENRLNWVDNLENITEKDKIPYLKYKINKRQTFNSAMLSQSFPGIVLYKSMMTLEMQLLHEGDLYTVLNSLGTHAKGLFDIQSCSIQRNPTPVESLLESTTDKNFSVNCILNWFTMSNKAFSGPAAEDI